MNYKNKNTIGVNFNSRIGFGWYTGHYKNEMHVELFHIKSHGALEKS